ncbi:MAG: DUF4190 domain-containing protein [Bilifractor sp.]
MKKCVHCGADMPDDAKACSNCGWPAEDYQDPSVNNGGSDKPGKDQSGMDKPDIDRPGVSDKGQSAESSDTGDAGGKDDKPERMPWDVLQDQQHIQPVQPASGESDPSGKQHSSSVYADTEHTEHKEAQQSTPSVFDDAEHSKEKFDIPWDPEEADREKEKARSAAGTGHGNHSETGGSDRAGNVAQNQGQEHTDSAEQPTGYWFQGKWHPLADLDAESSAGNQERSGNNTGRGNDWSSGNTWNSQNAGQNGSASQGGSFNQGYDHGYNRGYNRDNDGGPYYNWNSPFGNASSGGQGYPPRTSNFAVAAITMAVLSIFLNSLYCIPSVLGIIFAVMALQQMKKYPGQYKGKGMATAALAISIVLFVIYLIVFIEVAKLMQDPAFMQQIENYLKQLQGGSVSSSSSSVPTQVASIFRFWR